MTTEPPRRRSLSGAAVTTLSTSVIAAGLGFVNVFITARALGPDGQQADCHQEAVDGDVEDRGDQRRGVRNVEPVVGSDDELEVELGDEHGNRAQ